jgi:RNA polymerase sigma-70 factor (ECF subfamily)
MEAARTAALHDVELAALAAASDRAAYGELVKRHGPAVRGLLRRMGADPSAADDLAQDAFIVGFEQVADFRGEGSFAGWIKRIAARLYLRRMKRDAKLLISDQTPDEEDGAALDEPRTASRIDLDAALKGLSTVERLCVSLCYGADLSHSEAAEALNLPLGTVKSHVKRGLDKLRAKLAPAGTSGAEPESTRLSHG